MPTLKNCKKYFVSASLSPAYRDRAEAARTYWTTHRAEKWVGYP